MLGKVCALVVLSQSSASEFVGKLASGERKRFMVNSIWVSASWQELFAMRANGGKADGQ